MVRVVDFLCIQIQAPSLTFPLLNPQYLPCGNTDVLLPSLGGCERSGPLTGPLMSSPVSPQPHGYPCVVDIPPGVSPLPPAPQIHPSQFGLCSNIQASAPKALYTQGISSLNLDMAHPLEHVLNWRGYNGCPLPPSPPGPHSPRVAPRPLSLPTET